MEDDVVMAEIISLMAEARRSVLAFQDVWVKVTQGATDALLASVASYTHAAGGIIPSAATRAQAMSTGVATAAAIHEAAEAFLETIRKLDAAINTLTSACETAPPEMLAKLKLHSVMPAGRA